MTPFLSRIYDCKHRFEAKYAMVPTHLFLGPAETLELYDYIKELERAGLVKSDNGYSGANQLAGMKVVGLSSDGMHVGVAEIDLT